MIERIKKSANHIFIIVSLVAIALLVFIIYLYTQNIFYGDAYDYLAGPPAHSHPTLNGWSSSCDVCTTSGCPSGCASHIQAELNWLDAALPGFDISGGPLAVDGSYGGSTDAAVYAFQDWVYRNWDSSIWRDGDVGNQTWTFMEFFVLHAENQPGRHPAGVQLRYPVSNECVAITNNNTVDFAAPYKTNGEWVRFRDNVPNVSKSSGSSICAPSGGGGTGGGGDPQTYGPLCKCKSPSTGNVSRGTCNFGGTSYSDCGAWCAIFGEWNGGVSCDSLCSSGC